MADNDDRCCGIAQPNGMRWEMDGQTIVETRLIASIPCIRVCIVRRLYCQTIVETRLIASIPCIRVCIVRCLYCPAIVETRLIASLLLCIRSALIASIPCIRWWICHVVGDAAVVSSCHRTRGVAIAPCNKFSKSRGGCQVPGRINLRLGEPSCAGRRCRSLGGLVAVGGCGEGVPPCASLAPA